MTKEVEVKIIRTPGMRRPVRIGRGSATVLQIKASGANRSCVFVCLYSRGIIGSMVAEVWPENTLTFEGSARVVREDFCLVGKRGNVVEISSLN